MTTISYRLQYHIQALVTFQFSLFFTMESVFSKKSMDQCTPQTPATCGFEFASPQAIGHTNPEALPPHFRFAILPHDTTGLSMQHFKTSGPVSLVWNLIPLKVYILFENPSTVYSFHIYSFTSLSTSPRQAHPLVRSVSFSSYQVSHWDACRHASIAFW